MATPINTRILLRNDTLANWTGSSLVLGKGEVAIATGLDGNLVEVRVGNGTTAWSGAAKLAVDASQISGIIELIQGTAKKYQVVTNGEGGNSWKLQEAALSGGDWSDVTGSTWTVDFSAINDAISGLTADVDYLSSAIDDLDALVDDTRTTLVTVSTDYLKAADKNELTGADTYISSQVDALSTTLNTVSSDYLKATDFTDLSNEIGLSAASASNPVVTKDDIKDITGAMHFRGAVDDLSKITDPKAGDVAIITTTSKEYVYNGTEWIELGDEALYATKAEVATISADLTANDQYLSGQITSITSTYATKNELTGAADALSTDYNTKIDALSDAISDITGNYATKTELDDVSVALSTDYVGKINTAKTEALSDANAYTNEVSATLSADYQGKIDYLSNEISTIGGAYATKEYVNGISSSLSTDYVSKIGTAKTEAYNEALSDANNYTDGEINALSGTYIKKGEVTESDLSGFFILSCGASALRTDEPPFNA